MTEEKLEGKGAMERGKVRRNGGRKGGREGGRERRNGGRKEGVERRNGGKKGARRGMEGGREREEEWMGRQRGGVGMYIHSVVDNRYKEKNDLVMLDSPPKPQYSDQEEEGSTHS